MRKNIVVIFFGILVVLSLTSVSDKNELKKLPKGLRDRFSFVPAGLSHFETFSAATGSFYISKTEVSNAEYSIFLNDLLLTGKENDYKIAQIDSANWEGFGKYIQSYHSLPTYNNYPVVNISYEAATLYCEWLLRKYSNLKLKVRLPTREEWLKAAQGRFKYAKYSWGGFMVVNARGCELANFKNYSSHNIHFNDSLKTYQVIEVPSFRDNSSPAPVRSYHANDFYLFNMNGNAAEMVMEKGIAVGGSWLSTGYDIRNESIINYTKSSIAVGFRPVIILED
jgi:hypothetical protein